MLFCLADLLSAAGQQVTISLDERLSVPSVRDVVVHGVNSTECLAGAGMPGSWVELAHQADVTLVVAPEIDGILTRVVGQLRGAGNRLLNCADPFLRRAADKLQTAERLRAFGLAHPPTIALSELTDRWLREQRLADPRSGRASGWIIKPRNGAGSEGLSWHGSHAVREIMAEFAAAHSGGAEDIRVEDFLVQPYLAGDAYSCSAIIDRNGRPQWMPLMTQELTPHFQYRGGRIAPAAMQARRPHHLLQRTVESLQPGAMGWIGVDLLYRRSQQDWLVIEVNPRCTTSIVELARAREAGLGEAGLGQALVEACASRNSELTPES